MVSVTEARADADKLAEACTLAEAGMPTEARTLAESGALAEADMLADHRMLAEAGTQVVADAADTSVDPSKLADAGLEGLHVDVVAGLKALGLLPTARAASKAGTGLMLASHVTDFFAAAGPVAAAAATTEPFDTLYHKSVLRDFSFMIRRLQLLLQRGATPDVELYAGMGVALLEPKRAHSSATKTENSPLASGQALPRSRRSCDNNRCLCV